ncbi:MAG: aldo/keto reductase [Ruminococcaceae bacterium]|nr:aldo/keto reductase [Oscillospiraceae bacterium]
MNCLTDCYTLKNGVKVPCIGFGTWKMPEETAENAVISAISAGYRHIDTAAAYQNEAYVGKGVKKSGVSRDEIFLVSKLPNDDHGYENAIASCEKSLMRLGTDYLDSYLIHWPVLVQNQDRVEEDLCETWRAFLRLYEDGKLRSVGTSNFMEEHIEMLKKNFSVYPMINQVQMHPQNPQDEMVAYCKENNILPEAWSPLIQGQAFKRELLINMAAKYGVSVSQLCIRFIVQKGAVPVPKSSSPERIRENADVFGFNISDEDMLEIATLKKYGMIGNPPSVPRTHQVVGF